MTASRVYDALCACGYKLGKTLGRGSAGKVKEAIDENGNKVAIKIVKKSSSALREINHMAQLNHENVIELKRVIMLNKHICMVMTCAASQITKKVSECEAKRTFKQIVRAIAYCHKKNIAHRDIKCENILLCEDGQVKLADFGFSRDVKKCGLSRTFCGTVNYAAPEIVEQIAYSPKKADVYSLGVTLFCMLTGSEHVANIEEEELSEECKMVLKGMLAKESERFEVDQIENSDWLLNESK